MRILFITRRFYPDVIGGGEVSSLHIVKGLKARGHDVSVLAFTDKPTSDDHVERIPVHREQLQPLRGFRRLSNLDYLYIQIRKAALRYVKKLKPDVVHLIHFETIPYTAPALRKQFPNIPFFATVNGPIFSCFTQDGLDYRGRPCMGCKGPIRILNCIKKWGIIKGPVYWLYSLWYMPLLRRAYRAVTTFFAVSQAIALTLKAMDVPDERISIIHNPVRVQQNMTKKARDELKAELGISEDTNVLLYAGRLHETKGVQYTVKALPQLKNTVFVIVGKGPYEAQLRKLAKQLHVEYRIRFVGFVDPSKIKRFYAIADVVPHPCTFYEPLSRMLLEACSFGIPVVASDIAGNGEIIDHGKNGILLKTLNTNELVQAISYILTSRHRYKTMSEAAQKKIKNEFHPQLIAKQMEAQYKKGLALRDTI